MIPTFFGITLICFFLLRAAGDPTAFRQGEALRAGQMSDEQLAHLREMYGLDKHWTLQYGTLVWRLVSLDLGNRWQDGRPILDVVTEALPLTVALSVSSLLLAYLVSIPLGLHSAVRQHTWADRVTTLVLFILYALPSYWVGVLLLMWLSSGLYWDCTFTDAPGCFPLAGYRSFIGTERMTPWERSLDVLWHMVLPVVVLSYGSFASLSRYVRSSLLETMHQDYVRTARAKGLSEFWVIVRHAFRNGLLPIITLLGMELPLLISGALVVETIFGIRGMGLVALEALRMPDYPLALALVAFTAVLVMLGVLVSDLLYMLADPRIHLGNGTRH